MKKFFTRMIIGAASSIVFLAWNQAIATGTPTIPVIDVSQFIAQQKKLTDEQVQEQKDMIKELKATASVESQRLSALVATSKPLPSASTPEEEKTLCDCDNPNDPYNYAQNFFYNANGIKVSRINPACQCVASEQKNTTASTLTPINPITLSPQQHESIDWKIQY